MNISKELAELVGIIIGDGHIYKNFNKYRIGFTGNIITDRLYFDYIKELIKKEWNRNLRYLLQAMGLGWLLILKKLAYYLLMN